ncbi:hypothetical protein HPB48_010990 [Haemaphysalis longicornis]|uniref:ABC transporter domain-containing protein n=1 Tax=Haemaphysalis longicornis TaxID=44386 RepID=A0A9J6FYP7_HAELO|nr:hypothetical protein HPB48_010990 [Haemaphysalis longicornis]
MVTLKSVNLLDKIDNLPSDLSGGMKRRLSLAIALASRPKVSTLGEPVFRHPEGASQCLPELGPRRPLHRCCPLAATKMATAMDVSMPKEEDKKSTMHIGSHGGSTCTEIQGEEITPDDTEGWAVSGKRAKQIATGKDFDAVKKTPRDPARQQAEQIGAVAAPRAENEKVKHKIADLDAIIKAISAKLTQLVALQQQRQPPPQVSNRREEPLEDEPEAEIDPRAHKEMEPTPKRRAIEGAKDRKLIAWIDNQDDGFGKLQASAKISNERLTALGQACQQMTATMQRIQAMMIKMQAQLQTLLGPPMPSAEPLNTPTMLKPCIGQPAQLLPQ